MNKRVRIFLGITVLLAGSVFFSTGSATAGQNGEWEITTSLVIPGMPFVMPPTTVRNCLEEEAVPYQAKENEKCETITKKVSGNTVTWQVRCESEDGPVEMNGITSYTGDTMDSKVTMTGGQGDMSMHMTGRKLGPCK